MKESAARKQSMDRYSMNETTIVEIGDHRTFAPIADWTIDDVWTLLSGCSYTDTREPWIFETYTHSFQMLNDLYRDANDGVCGVIVGNSANSAACGSRFGCAYCTLAGDRDKSLESMLQENPEKYGFMQPFVDFRKYLLAIRFDLKLRDYRGRSVSNIGYQKVVPDYFNPTTKRNLLRYLLTMDAMEVERASRHADKYYSGAIEKTEENLLLTEPLFQNVSYDDLLAVDFAWSLSRDFRESSPAARDWIEIHELGYRYHIPNVPTAPRVSIPKARWFDISTQLDQPTQGIKGLVPARCGLQELNIKFGNELAVTPASGWSYINSVRDHYFELEHVDPAEVCRAALHNQWIVLRKSDLERYERIALRHDYIYKLYAQERPMIEDEARDGDLRLMTIHEYMLENSISDQEHSEIMKEKQRQQIEVEYADDLLGAETVFEAIEARKESPKPVKRFIEKNLSVLVPTRSDTSI